MLQTIQSIKGPDSKPDNKESIWSTFAYYADNIIISVTKGKRDISTVSALLDGGSAVEYTAERC